MDTVANAGNSVSHGRLFTLFAVVLATNMGCVSGVRLFDEASAAQSALVKAKYTEVDILRVIDEEKTNLANLLGEELKTVRENTRLQIDYALLSLASNTTPSAITYSDETILRIQQLGYSDGPQQLRLSLQSRRGHDLRNRQLLEHKRRITGLSSVIPPDCSVNVALPDTLQYPATLDATKKTRTKSNYHLYKWLESRYA